MSKNTGKEYELLNYRDGLDNVAKLRYDQKCTIINGVDPYNVSAHTLTWSKDVNKLPCVMYPDICNYLIHTPGQYTYDDLKAWRSLDAVNQLHNGWVSDRAAIVFDESVLVTAKVMHSQRLREKPLQPWVITEPEGPIKAAHCNCMAGLGEACTHIAALLWSINATVALRDSATVTDKKAYWMLPTSRKTVQYKEVSKINFTSTKSAKKKFGEIIEGHSIATQETVTPKTPVSRKKIPRANYDDLTVLCEKMNKLKVKPAILALVPPYANEFRPKTDTKNFPQALNDLKDTDCISASVEKVKEVCSKIDIHCSVEQACIVEEETRLQSKNKLWYKFRAGRITASRAKSVCATDSESPAPSIIKGICYPDSYKFQNSATRYGLDNEKRARDKFLDVMAEHHEKLLVEDSGFHISTVHPFIGASPDGIVHCDCCGTACLEIKCPYSAEDKDVDHNTCECLTEKDGLVQLKTTHPYYYQVQAQLGVTGHDFAYFVVWSSCAIHIEIINFNSIVWKEICEKSRLVFYNGVLPELVGKVFTRLPISKKPVVETAQHNDSTSNSDTVASSNSQDSMPSSSNSEAKENKQEDPKGPAKKMRGKKSLKKKSVLKSSDNFPMTSDEILYCVCEQVEFGRMVACDNIECPGEWFHYGCVNLENAPEGKWYCPDCRKLPAFKRKRSIRN